MNRLAYLLITVFALATNPRADMSATSPHPLAGDVEILVGDAPQPRYAHAGRWYVEARQGSDYAIKLRNPYGVRVAVALSVDGLNTIDAGETTAGAARKWVLGPYETIVISGWQTTQTEARRFEFTTEPNSYGHALGKTANLGVISAVYFRERVATVSPYTGNDLKERPAPSARSSLGAAEQSAAAAKRADDEYAATGMGRRTAHPVTEVRLDLEDTPAQSVTIRYEFRPQLVRLGILPPARTADPLQRRERARGFEPGFCPEPPRHR